MGRLLSLGSALGTALVGRLLSLGSALGTALVGRLLSLGSALGTALVGRLLQRFAVRLLTTESTVVLIQYTQCTTNRHPRIVNIIISKYVHCIKKPQVSLSACF